MSYHCSTPRYKGLVSTCGNLPWFRNPNERFVFVDFSQFVSCVERTMYMQETWGWEDICFS
jgi:hypothetical protein